MATYYDDEEDEEFEESMDDNGELVLAELLQSAIDEAFYQSEAATNPAPEPTPKRKFSETEHSQWAVGSNGQFMPVGLTTPKLEPGVYTPFAMPGVFGVEKMVINSDNIYTLPDMATEGVLKEVEKFWSSEHKYRNHNLLYKRGILLWGPPGSGKTVTVKLLMNELIKREGIVIVVHSVPTAAMVLKALRKIEPKRKLITLFEDIDEIIQYNGEASVLSMLDGEHSIDNILQLATTNYPERLGARIINRPSRFDTRVNIGMPEAAARESYLIQATNGGLTKKDVNKWVKDTKELSIAHLRELVAAVYCLDQPYEEVIDRLKKMAVEVKGDTGFAPKRNMGFRELAGSGSSSGWGG